MYGSTLLALWRGGGVWVKFPEKRHYIILEWPPNCVIQIIELEDKLRAEGKLKTQADVDEFWCNMRKSQVYRKYYRITAQQTTLETDTVIQILLTGV